MILVMEFGNSSGKSQGILLYDVCGNPERVCRKAFFITKINFYVIEKKKVNYFFFRFFCE